ncbi:MAG TPA: prolyl oligopeptidase family serine peptidase [Ruminiclostridium sp.]|nr:prolyl oligopeptidase family serine peptidase [Ruminiclostridium sp.]
MKKFKKAVSLILAISILSGTAVYAADTTKSVGSGDMYVPVKYLVDEALWDAKAKTATFYIGKSWMSVKVGSNQMMVNTVPEKLAEKVAAVDGRVVLPISVIEKYMIPGLTSDDYLKRISTRFIDMVKKGQTAESSFLISKNFSKHLTGQFINSVLAPAFSIIEPDTKKMTILKNAVHQNVLIPFTVQQAKYNFILRFDYDGKIDEMNQQADTSQFTYSKPAYDNPQIYTEKEVSFGEGEFKMPGTLTMPKGKGPFPAIILVHGSGPDDRDETVGPLKPFRDLAVGLASQGVAVLRYEKRTLEYGVRVQQMPKLTMTEEFEQDALSAANYLKTVDGIDASNITVLGHSEGGYDLPRILQSDKTGLFKAGIIMSGCTRPLYELLPEQYKYLSSLGGVTEQQVEAMKAQVDMIEDKSFDPANPPKGYTLGTPYYYYDMKNYDVIGTAKAIEKPVLVLQGERDYQVNPKTDYEGWQKAFEGKTNVEFKLYPKLNHMYTEGEGQPNPSEYYVNANIPQYVISDIAAFIKK